MSKRQAVRRMWSSKNCAATERLRTSESATSTT